MHPTGIAIDEIGNLYVNDWYMIPTSVQQQQQQSKGKYASKEEQIDWGNEPQHLHNVRIIRTSDACVRTIAGGNIRKHNIFYFMPVELLIHI